MKIYLIQEFGTTIQWVDVLLKLGVKFYHMRHGALSVHNLCFISDPIVEERGLDDDD